MSAPSSSESPSQFDRLGQRRFAPFFWVQFLGEMNDKVFKFAFTVLGCLSKPANAIRIVLCAEGPAASEAAFDAADTVLADGELLDRFPEGGITRDDSLPPFRRGLMKNLGRSREPVVSMALTNLWSSFFSRAEGGSAMVKTFGRVGVVGAPDLPANAVELAALQKIAVLATSNAQSPSLQSP